MSEKPISPGVSAPSVTARGEGSDANGGGVRALWSEEDCLDYGPFEGDRDVDVTPLRDGFVVTRKATRCHTCDEEIAKGTRVRSITEAFDGQIGTWRFCPICCEAMARSWTDDGDAIEERYAVGERNRRSHPTVGEIAESAADATVPPPADLLKPASIERETNPAVGARAKGARP